MSRLLLVRHATSAETRRSAFPATTGAERSAGCAPLDRAGVEAARALAGALPPADRCWVSLAVRSRQTAELLGLTSVPDPDLAECDFGSWAGRTPAEIETDDPDGLRAWWADPDSAPHGGEGLADVRRRARRVLARADRAGGTTIAVTHGGLIKAVLLEVLGLPAAAAWRLDAAPASVTELHSSGGSWRLTRTNWSPSLRGAEEKPVTAEDAEAPAVRAAADREAPAAPGPGDRVAARSIRRVAPRSGAAPGRDRPAGRHGEPDATAVPE
jgi:broad specificity phosphatase PhoE